MADADHALEARAQGRLGSVLRGKYRLDRVLGVGGMAVVFAATHRNQKQFAIKMLHPEFSLRSDVRQRFLREGYAANSVRHRGAVAVLDDDVTEDGAAFLVMEFLEGLPLETIWEAWSLRLPVEHALAVGYQLLDVIAAAHGRGIVHRDIKPANVFVTYEGALKVLDFGIARVRDLAAGDSNATGTGVVLGTPAFMAPEQALGRAAEIDAQTDIWAMGAMLFTLISGRTVHEGQSAQEVLVHAATKPPRSLAAVAPELASRVVSVIDRALGFAKEDRWLGANDMREAIQSTHTALFGSPIGNDSLLPLFERTPPRPAAQSLRVRAAEPSGQLPPTLDEQYDTTEEIPVGKGETVQATPVTVASAPLPEIVGATTAQPVSETAGRAQQARKRGASLAVGIGAVTAVAIAFVVLRPYAPSSSTKQTSVVSAASSVVPSPATSSVPLNPSAAPSTVRVEDLPPAPSVPASVASVVPRPAPAPAGRTAPTGFASARPAPAAPAATCTPPFFYDDKGRKIFKPDCVN